MSKYLIFLRSQGPCDIARLYYTYTLLNIFILKRFFDTQAERLSWGNRLKDIHVVTSVLQDFFIVIDSFPFLPPSLTLPDLDIFGQSLAPNTEPILQISSVLRYLIIGSGWTTESVKLNYLH